MMAVILGAPARHFSAVSTAACSQVWPPSLVRYTAGGLVPAQTSFGSSGLTVTDQICLPYIGDSI